MQTSLFISHLFINRTFHRQTNYTFKYRNMSLVANHSNNQSQLITEYLKKGKEMAAPPPNPSVTQYLGWSQRTTQIVSGVSFITDLHVVIAVTNKTQIVLNRDGTLLFLLLLSFFFSFFYRGRACHIIRCVLQPRFPLLL